MGKITKRSPAPIKRDFLKVARQVTAAEMQEEELAQTESAAKAKPKGRRVAEAEEE